MTATLKPGDIGTRRSSPSSRRSTASTHAVDENGASVELRLVTDNYAAHKHAEVTSSRWPPTHGSRCAFHSDPRLVDEPRRGLVQPRRTPCRPTLSLSRPPRPQRPNDAPTLRAGSSTPTQSCGPRPPRRSSRRPTVQQLQVRTTGDLREGGDVAELTGLIDPGVLKKWPTEMRVVARRETSPPRRAALVLRSGRRVARPGVRHQHHRASWRAAGVPRSPPPGLRPVEDRIRYAKDTGIGRFPSREFAINQT